MSQHAVDGGRRALARRHIAINRKPINVVHDCDLDAHEVRCGVGRISILVTDA